MTAKGAQLNAVAQLLTQHSYATSNSTKIPNTVLNDFAFKELAATASFFGKQTTAAMQIEIAKSIKCIGLTISEKFNAFPSLDITTLQQITAPTTEAARQTMRSGRSSKKVAS